MLTTIRSLRGADAFIPSSLSSRFALDEAFSFARFLDASGCNEETEHLALSSKLRFLSAVSGRDREIRLFAVWCARRVQRLAFDQRVAEAALRTAERLAGRPHSLSSFEIRAALYAAGLAVDEAAWHNEASHEAAWWALFPDPSKAASCAAASAVNAVCRVTSNTLAGVIAKQTEIDAQATEFRRVCAAIEAGQEPYPVGGLS